MEIKCGTDIIEIERIKKSIENMGDKFLNTIFTKNEIAYCEARKMQKYQSYAARFAAKEAAFKAVGEYMDKSEINWTTFEVEKNNTGKPVLKINCEIEKLESIDISISHCKEYAVANVVAIFSK